MGAHSVPNPVQVYRLHPVHHSKFASSLPNINMASLQIRNGIFYAQYSDKNFKLHRKSTRIRVPANFTRKPGKNGRRIPTQAEKDAQSIAETWEKLAKGHVSNDNAQALLIAAAKMKAESSPIAKDWLTRYQPRGGEQNHSNSRRSISLFIEFLEKNDIPNIRLADITKQHSKQFLGEQLRDNGLATGTVDSYRNHLSRAFKVAIEEEVLKGLNPFALVKMKDIRLEYIPERKGSDKLERRPFTADELKIILNDFPQPFRDLAAVSFFTGGQRIGDCIRLQWSQVDFKKGLVTFKTQKTGKLLVQPLTPSLRQRLEARQQRKASNASPYVFPDLMQQAERSKGIISTRFTALLYAYGIQHEETSFTNQGNKRKNRVLSFHCLRYSAVTALRVGGISADVSRAVVGHDSEAIERIYFNPDHENKRNALAVLEAILQPLPT